MDCLSRYEIADLKSALDSHASPIPHLSTPTSPTQPCAGGEKATIGAEIWRSTTYIPEKDKRAYLLGLLAQLGGKKGLEPSTLSKNRLGLSPSSLLPSLLSSGLLPPSALKIFQFIASGPHPESHIISVDIRESLNSGIQENHGIRLRKRERIAARVRRSGRGVRCKIADDRIRLWFPRRRPKKPNYYAVFSMWKHNVETRFAVRRIAKHLKLDADDITYQGTKDRRAVTIQLIAARGVRPERIKGLSHILDREEKGRICISRNCVYEAEKGLQLGGHGGNRFKILLGASGNLEGSDWGTRVSESVRKVTEAGFANYFGPQRFGLSSCVNLSYNEKQGRFPTWNISLGHALLTNDPQRAVRAALTLYKDLPPRIYKALEGLHQPSVSVQASARIAHASLPRSATALRALLRELSRQSRRRGEEKLPFWSRDTCAFGLRAVPYRERVRWVQSYQSYVWNLTVSECLAREPKGSLRDTDQVARRTRYEPRCSTVRGEDVFCVGINDGFRFSDLVVPLPGYIVLSKTQVNKSFAGKVINKILRSHAVNTSSFRVNIAGVRAPGAFRRAIAKPHNLQWCIFEPRDSQACQQQCRGDKRQYRGDKGKHQGVLEVCGECLARDWGKDTKEGWRWPLDAIFPNTRTNKWILISVDLGVSAYATSLLRELAKKKISEGIASYRSSRL